ncbi:MAG: response regulator transcription factor [Halobacteriovoraceae bacterium]|nr:response regulator transcription factor [Halobacteriovoraceae bacterium]
MGKKQVLVVDDDHEIFALIREKLGNDYEFYHVMSCSEVIPFLKKKKMDLIVLDNHLPDGMGTHLGRDIKSSADLSKIPIIMLTKNAQTSNKVLAFENGVSDYLTKPFDTMELMMRIKTIFRDISTYSGVETKISLEDLVIDMDRFQVSFKGEEGNVETIELTMKEIKLLWLLVKNMDNVLTREDILNQIWENDFNITYRTIDQHISKLRKKIKKSIYHIKTVHGIGYCFTLNQKRFGLVG